MLYEADFFHSDLSSEFSCFFHVFLHMFLHLTGEKFGTSTNWTLKKRKKIVWKVQKPRWPHLDDERLDPSQIPCRFWREFLNAPAKLTHFIRSITCIKLKSCTSYFNPFLEWSFDYNNQRLAEKVSVVLIPSMNGVLLKKFYLWVYRNELNFYMNSCSLVRPLYIDLAKSEAPINSNL